MPAALALIGTGEEDGNLIVTFWSIALAVIGSTTRRERLLPMIVCTPRFYAFSGELRRQIATLLPQSTPFGGGRDGVRTDAASLRSLVFAIAGVRL